LRVATVAYYSLASHFNKVNSEGDSDFDGEKEYADEQIRSLIQQKLVHWREYGLQAYVFIREVNAVLLSCYLAPSLQQTRAKLLSKTVSKFKAKDCELLYANVLFTSHEQVFLEPKVDRNTRRKMIENMETFLTSGKVQEFSRSAEREREVLQRNDPDSDPDPSTWRHDTAQILTHRNQAKNVWTFVTPVDKQFAMRLEQLQNKAKSDADAAVAAATAATDAATAATEAAATESSASGTQETKETESATAKETKEPRVDAPASDTKATQTTAAAKPSEPASTINPSLRWIVYDINGAIH